LQWLIDVLSDAFLCASQEGAVVACNEAACRLLGYSRHELCALRCDDLSADPEARRALEARDREGSFRGKIRLNRKNDAPIEVEAASVVMRLGDEPPQVWITISSAQQQRRADEATYALRESNELLRALSDAAFEAILVHRDGHIMLANHAAEVMAQVRTGELVGKQVFDFIAPESHELARSKIAAGDPGPYEAVGQRADGSTFPVEVRARMSPIQLAGRPARVVALRDLTEGKRLEEESRQAQKMEAIGRLAGGVAHDFNNMLVVILSGLELAAETLDPSHPSRAELDEIKRAALRAKELTRDLLALSHKQLLNVRVIEVGALIEDMRTMISRLIGEDIELAVHAARNGLRAKLDPAQLEIVIMNLVVNARDAMPHGGRLTVEVTISETVDTKLPGPRDAPDGPFVRICVNDTGSGMDDATKARIYEPFFTTKGPGKGTGLGLATVFGIVKQSGGRIAVESEIGQGTTFRIWFPFTSEPLSVERAASHRPEPQTRRVTVLVVEDEIPVRRSVVLSLRGGGYDVLEAARPDAAIELVRSHEGPIDLLLTDVVMPQMSGRMLSQKILALRPDLRVLYVSGYTEDAIVHRGVLDAGLHFLQKPFSGSGLLDAVARVLR
jgi:PAS domain S-box-containing protein